jgi:hypothetical protein
MPPPVCHSARHGGSLFFPHFRVFCEKIAGSNGEDCGNPARCTAAMSGK